MFGVVPTRSDVLGDLQLAIVNRIFPASGSGDTLSEIGARLATIAS